MEVLKKTIAGILLISLGLGLTALGVYILLISFSFTSLGGFIALFGFGATLSYVGYLLLRGESIKDVLYFLSFFH